MKVVEDQNQEQLQEQQTVDINDLTAEQLRSIVIEQNQMLRQMDLSGIFRRLEFLLKIVSMRDAFDNKEFIASCTKEIEQLMTIKKNE